MLKGKTALVTGSTQGLGLATVERLASHGCNIVMNGLGNAEAIGANRRRIAEARGARVLHHGADLSKAREKLPRDAAVKAFMGSCKPSGRFVSPDRVAGLIAFLCGPNGADTTGSAISIDGGWSAA